MNFNNTDITPGEYARIHMWLGKEYGKANHCDNPECKIENPKKYEWALKKGYTYEKNINNYIQLCKSCHLHYDKKDEWGQTISKTLLKHYKEKIIVTWNKGLTHKEDNRIKGPKGIIPWNKGLKGYKIK